MSYFGKSTSMGPELAYETLIRFASENSEVALRLAMHAAVPQAFRPDLLHLLKLNFIPKQSADPEYADAYQTAEADVLLSPACRHIGSEFFEFDPEIRRLLLDNLVINYAEDPRSRIHKVANFMLTYADHQSASLQKNQLWRDYLEIQRWVALGFIDPDAAAEQMAAVLNYLDKENQFAAHARIGGIASALSVQLTRHQQLLKYAIGLQELETGQVASAKRYFEGIDSELRIGNITLRSPNELLSDWQQPRMPPAEEVIEAESKRIRKIKIFVSSSADVANERRTVREVVDELNLILLEELGCQLEMPGYDQSTVSEVGVNAAYISAGEFDIAIFILWQRMGTPVTDYATGEKYGSGTEYEFQQALQASQRNGKPEILVYRRTSPISLNADMDQVQKVNDFFNNQFQDSEIITAGYNSYEDEQDFREKLLNHLRIVVSNIDSIETEIEGQEKSEDLRGFSSSEQTSTILLNVPNWQTSYVAPEPDFEAVRDLLVSSDKDIVITGQPGVGKTLLATAICHDSTVQVRFADGIYWLNVAGISELDDLFVHFKAIFKMLTGEGINVASQDWLIAQAQDTLSEKRLLLVLNGLDELTPSIEAQSLISEFQWISVSQANRMLITSRLNLPEYIVNATDQFGIHVLGESKSAQSRFSGQRVFVSYGRDAALANQIIQLLRDTNLEVVPTDLITLGIDWRKLIDEQLDNALVFIVIVSDEVSLERSSIRYEFSRAQELSKPIIPVVIGGDQIPSDLAKFQYIDFRNNLEKGFEQLNEALNYHLNQDPSSILASENYLFVNHSRQDQQVANQLTDTIRANGFNVWADNQLFGGQDWWREIERRIRECAGMVYLISPSSVNSEYCIRELELAQRLGKPVLPVLVSREVDIPESLRSVTHIDLSGAENDLIQVIDALMRLRSEGISASIGQHAERIYNSLPGTDSEKTDHFHRVFRELVEVDKRGKTTKRLSSIERFNDKEREFVRAFTDARLFITSSAGSEKVLVEVADEALFRSWERLKKWIEDAGAAPDKMENESLLSRSIDFRAKLSWVDPQTMEEREYILGGDDETVSIGRAGGNDIVIPDGEISRYHAEFELDVDGRWFLIDRSSTFGTFIDGDIIEPDEPVKLQDDMVITIGSTELTFFYL